ncbi:MAG: phosphoribosylglycinamide formyltransferase [Candidatus Riflebacteria bacterium]
MIRAAVFISGRGSNLAKIIQQCQAGTLRECCRLVGVVSNRPEAGGVEIAKNAGLPVIVFPAEKEQTREKYDKALLKKISEWKPEIIILAGFDRILSKVMVKAFPNKILNIHPADPKLFRGLNGYKWAFENRLESTRVTVHLVDEGVDTGPVLATAVVSLTGAASLEEVEARGLAVEHRLYPKAVRQFVLQLMAGRNH